MAPATAEKSKWLATDRALRGDDLHADDRFGGRFERVREREIVVPGASRSHQVP